MMNTNCVARVGLAILCSLVSYDAASGQTLTAAKVSNVAAVDHADRAIAAVDLAIIAAECDIRDVSFDAVMRR